MLADKDGLWYRVLKAIYREEGGRLKEGGRDSSVWWRMISGIRERRWGGGWHRCEELV